MKRVICIICLMVGCIGGCAPVILYHPNKTLEQCRQDSLECEFHDPFVIWLPFRAPGAPPYYHSCMTRKGYKALTQKQWSQLPTKTRKQQAVPFSQYYLAGR